MTEVLAGFECGRLGWNGHDILMTTRHLPGNRMERHYGIAQDHGVTRARDAYRGATIPAEGFALRERAAWA